MKTTERHQDTPEVHDEPLNDVSDVLSQIAPYWRTIAGVGLVGITAIVLFGVISNNRRTAEEASWANYFSAIDNGNAQALQELANSSSGAVVPWAHQAAAQSKLIEGSNNLYKDREQAKAELEEAVAGFTAAVAGSTNSDLLNQRSLWGLGQAHEGLNDLEKAKSAYQQLLDRWPESPLAKRAQERIANLNSPETQDFYKWFFAQEPVTPPAFDPATSQSLDVPSEPDVTIPSTIPSPSLGSGGVSELDDTEPAGTSPEPSGESATEEVDGSDEASSEDLGESADPTATDEADTGSTENSTDVSDVVEDADATPVDVIPDP